MTDKDKVYNYEKLLKMTIENYQEMLEDTKRILTLVPNDRTLKVRIIAYNDIIKVLTTILNKLGDK